jgi:hypothetical protein
METIKYHYHLNQSVSHFIKDYDIMEDIIKPFDKKPWLVRDKIKDLILF